LTELVHFESAVTDALLQALSRETFKPEFIQFFYPTPSIEEEETLLS